MFKSSLEIITLKKPAITDYAKERNSLIAASHASWVLFLDTDETLSSGLLDEIKKRIKTKKYNGYYITRKNYFLGRYVGNDKILRLARRGSGFWRRTVHETWEINGNVGFLSGFIQHNTAQTLYGYVEKLNKYSDLHARANKKEGKNPSLFKVLFYPFAKFLQTYLKSGDTVFSIMQSIHSFLSWSKLYFLYF